MSAEVPVHDLQVGEGQYRQHAAMASPGKLDRSSIDARVIALFDNARLQSKVRRLDKVELVNVWRATKAALEGPGVKDVAPVSPLEVHNRLVEGLAGVALLVSSARC